MTQPARPRPTVPDYATTIIGALELSERKWVVAVQLPGLKRHSRHVLEARCDDLDRRSRGEPRRHLGTWGRREAAVNLVLQP